MTRKAIIRTTGLFLTAALFGAGALTAEYYSNYGGVYKKYPRNRKLHARAPGGVKIAKNAKAGQIKGGYYRVPVTFKLGNKTVPTTARYKNRLFRGYFKSDGIGTRFSMRVRELRIGYDLKADFTYFKDAKEIGRSTERYRKRRRIRADERPVKGPVKY